MYAIIKQGGKQYKVQEGDYLTLDKINAQPKDTIEVTDVLAIGDDKLTIGEPFVKNAKVELEVVHSGRGKKVIIFKKRRRKDSKLKRGFRRSYTQVKVSKIVA